MHLCGFPPLLHTSARYASFFGFCYTCLLPGLNDAPRYARHQFRRHAAIMSLIADGYADGYTSNDPALKQAFALEYMLWVLEWTYGNDQLLTISTKINDYEPAAKLPSRRI